MMCNGQLALYARSIETIEAAGLRVAGISVDSVERNRALAEKLAVPFPLLADPSGDVIKRWGYWRDDEGGIAEATTVIVGRDMRLTFERVSAHPAGRPLVAEVVAAAAL
ncbi:hypothetical protein BH18CHL2_BH18CHL2_00800 [soil metagenome]